MENARDAIIKVKKTVGINERLKLVTEIVRSSDPGKVAVIGHFRRQLIPYQIYYASDGAPFKIATDLDIFDSKAFDDLIRLLEIWARSGESRRTYQVTDDAIEICNLIKWYPLNKKDRRVLSTHLRRSSTRTTVEAVVEIADYHGPKLRGKTHQALHAIANEFVKAKRLPDAIRIIDDKFTGLHFDQEKAEEDPWYTDPPLKQLADISENENLNPYDLIERIENTKEQIQEYRSFEEDIGNVGVGGIMERPLHLMTATRAKGKEFDTVIILDAVDGIWPYRRTGDSREIEAERRLFYVAFTRAREKVVLLTQNNAPLSPFIHELGLDID